MLEIRTLGGLTIEINGCPVSGFASRKAEALLVYLAYTGRSHPREVLAEMFWSDRPQAQSLSSFRVTLTHLREHLAPFVTATRQSITMNANSPYWLDVTELEELLSFAETSDDVLSTIIALTNAVDLYAGDFLSGFSVRGSPAFEEWARNERERLRRTIIEALRCLIAYHLEQDAFSDGITHATRLLSLDAYHEETHRDLMLLLARSGQRTEALAQFESCRKLLIEELGIEPTAETMTLCESIHNGEIAVSRPSFTPRHNLPAQLAPFIGREAEMEQLTAMLEQTRLVTLTGLGGIGKTRLALEFAAQQSANYENGVFFVSLVAVSLPERIVGAVAEAVKYRFQNEDRLPEQQLLDYLRAKHMLLVLDNFEHLLDGATLVTAILQHAPGVKILVTSREKLNLMGENVIPIGGLELPENERPEDLLRYSALRLFFQSAWQQQPEHDPQNDNVQHAAHICRLVEGMPLGVLLAATWVNLLSLTKIAQEIEQSYGFLAAETRDLPNRHSSMRAVFESSWRRLSAAQRDALMKLSVFRGSFTRHAAQQITSASLRILSDLLGRSLLRRNPSTGRHDMHELLRQFAEEQLELSGMITSARNAHADYYLNFIHQRTEEIKGSRQLAALNEIDLEFENIRVAWYWAAERQNATVIDPALEGLYLYCDMRNHWTERHHLMQYACEYFAPIPDEAPSRFWARLRARTIYHGEPETAIPDYTHFLELAKQHQDEFEIAFCLWQLGCAHGTAGDFTGAMHWMEDSLLQFQAIGDHYYITSLLREIAFYGMCQAVWTTRHEKLLSNVCC